MQYLQQNLKPTNYHAIIIAGDFNLHHPTWNHPKYHRHDTEADDLVEEMLQLGMQLIIPPGTITYPKSGTAIDLVWGNEQAINNIIKYSQASMTAIELTKEQNLVVLLIHDNGVGFDPRTATGGNGLASGKVSSAGQKSAVQKAKAKGFAHVP